MNVKVAGLPLILHSILNPPFLAVSTVAHPHNVDLEIGGEPDPPGS